MRILKVMLSFLLSSAKRNFLHRSIHINRSGSGFVGQVNHDHFFKTQTKQHIESKESYIYDNDNNYNAFENGDHISHQKPVQFKHFSIAQNFPTGIERNERLKNCSASSDLELSFVGTASCNPTTSRGVSCVLMRSSAGMWLFDCGESTQIQLQKSVCRFSRINKIFVTHMHGDHVFGIGGVLCMIGTSRLSDEHKNAAPVEIFGPEGLRDYIRAVISLTYSKVVCPHIIHEIKNIPQLHEMYSKKNNNASKISSKHTLSYGEVSVGRDIYPNADGTYDICVDGDFTVKAAPLQHTIPCVGFVVEEETKSNLRAEIAEPIVERNKIELSKQLHNYKKALAILKSLKATESFKFPDGTEVFGADVSSVKGGRKIVFMGDCSNGDKIMNLAKDATLLIHEATNSWDPLNDKCTYLKTKQETIEHGHSTPQMAAAFAKAIGAKRLVLTHFSQRYRGDSSATSMKDMWQIEDIARVEANCYWGKNDIIAAWDCMQLFV